MLTNLMVSILPGKHFRIFLYLHINIYALFYVNDVTCFYACIPTYKKLKWEVYKHTNVKHFQ